MMNNNAGMLHRTAKTVLHAAEDNPPEWWEEFATWIVPLIGKQPEEKLGTRAHENWNLVALGALLAWGYFSEMLGEAVKEDDETRDAVLRADVPVVCEEVLPVVEAAGSGDGGGGTQLSESSGLVREAFAVLGPDGQPLIEGYK